MTPLALSLACSIADPSTDPGVAPPAGRVIHEHRRKWYRDADGDGHGDPDTWHRSLTRPPGHVANATDCDDNRADVFESCEVELADADLVIEGMDDELIGWPVVVGDPTGDGIADVVIGSKWLDDSTGGVYVIAGPTTSGTVTASEAGIDIAYTGRVQLQFGQYVATGDTNADGFDDVVVSSFEYGGIATVFTFLGPITGRRTDRNADAYWEGRRGDQVDGVVAAADLSGDSVGDLLVTSWDSGTSVYVFSGTEAGTHAWSDDATYTYSSTSMYGMGFGPTELVDVSGDGVSDFAVQEGLGVVVIEGGDAPGSYDAPSVAVATIDLESGPLYVGSGDWDDDGYGDVFAPGFQLSAFLGPLSGELAWWDAQASWSVADDSFQVGDHAVAVGDPNGDGERDVLMGAQFAETPSGGLGMAYLQLGLVSGAVDVGTLLAFPAGADDNIGASTAFVPDWTGDGGDEIAIGSTTFLSADRRGKIYVLSSDQIL